MTKEEYANLKIKDIVCIDGNGNSKDLGCYGVVRGFAPGKIVVEIEPGEKKRYSWRNLRFVSDIERE
jgi:hypothetical protein